MPLFLLTWCGVALLWGLPSLGLAQTWPNEPVGSTVLNDYNFSAIPGSGWLCAFGCGTIASDATAPISPSSVLEFRLPVGSTAGGGDPYFDFSPRNEIFLAFYWKPSNPFEGYPSLNNKIVFTWLGESVGQLVWYMYAHNAGNPAGPFQFGVQMEMPTINNSHLGNGFGDIPGSWNLFPNQSSANLPLGTWIRIEIHARTSTTSTSRDGLLEWWVNGTLTGRYNNANLPTSFRQIQFTPAWDGSGPIPHSTAISHWFDHVRLSTGGSGGGSDTTPPSQVTGVTATPLP